MTILIATFITLVCALRRKIFIPIRMFICYWIIVLSLHFSDLYEKPITSVWTYVVIFTGIIFFILGYLFFSKVSINTYESTYKKERIDKICIFLVLLGILFMLPYFLLGIKNVLSGLGAVYNKNQLIQGEQSLGVGFVYISKPIRIVSMFIAASRIRVYKENKVLISLSLILMFMEYVSTGSKAIFAYFAVIAMVSLFNNINSEIRTNKVFAISVALVSGGAILFSMLKSLNTLNRLFESLYFYICGSISFMNYSLSLMDTKYQALALGAVSFNGPLRVIDSILSFINLGLGEWFERGADYISNLEYFTYFSSNRIFNSLTTCFFDFYLDGGLLGVCVMSFIMGAVINKIYRKSLFCSNEYYYILYLISIYFIINSASTFLLINVSYAMALIYLYIIYKVIGKYDWKIGRLSL